MAYCGPRGIRYTEFLEWDPVDRDAALAWQNRESARCGGCGTVPADWLNDWGPDGQPVANELTPVMHAQDQYCAGCGARHRHEATHKDGAPPGVHTVFVPNPNAIWHDPPASDADTE